MILKPVPADIIGSVLEMENETQPEGFDVLLYDSNNIHIESEKTSAFGEFVFRNQLPDKYYIMVLGKHYKNARWPERGCFELRSGVDFVKWSIQIAPNPSSAKNWLLYH